jgi:hypothetical protein
MDLGPRSYTKGNETTEQLQWLKVIISLIAVNNATIDLLCLQVGSGPHQLGQAL